MADVEPLIYTVRSSHGGWLFTYDPPAPPTEEEREWYAAEQRRIVDEWHRQQELARRAQEKAKALFLSCLTEKQKKQYEKENCFKVTGSSRGRYVINCHSTIENVWRTKHGKPVIMYCAAPRGASVNYDIWLAQKLILESDEKTFLSVAVKTSYK